MKIFHTEEDYKTHDEPGMKLKIACAMNVLFLVCFKKFHKAFCFLKQHL